MPTLPKVSVLMPAFNSADLIGEAIESILEQTYSSFELLILNDGSTDHTAAILSTINDSRIRIFTHQHNEGYLKSCNFLFSKAVGELVTFQDSDDRSHPKRLEIQVKSFLDDPQLMLCGTSVAVGKSRKQETEIPILPEKYEDILLHVESKRQVCFCGATLMVRHEVLSKIGVYRDFFNRIGAEDNDWALRIIEKFKAVNIAKSLYFYRFNPNSVTKTFNGDLKKWFSSEIAFFFHEQRMRVGYDDIMVNDFRDFNAFFYELTQSYRQNPGKIFFDQADLANNYGLKLRALGLICQAIQNGPLNFVNYLKFPLFIVKICLGRKILDRLKFLFLF